MSLVKIAELNLSFVHDNCAFCTVRYKNDYLNREINNPISMIMALTTEGVSFNYKCMSMLERTYIFK